MTTPFYKRHHERPFAFTLMMWERLGVLASESDDGAVSWEQILELADGNIAMAEYVALRLAEPAPKPRQEAQPWKKSGKDYGSSLRDALAGMEPWQQMVAAWGWGEAFRMYCEEDRDDALAALGVWHALRWLELDTVFEAALYASGGKYKGSGEEVTDLSEPGGFDAMFAHSKTVN